MQTSTGFFFAPIEEKARGKRQGANKPLGCQLSVSLSGAHFCSAAYVEPPKPSLRVLANDKLPLILSELIHFRFGNRNKLMLAGTHNSGPGICSLILQRNKVRNNDWFWDKISGYEKKFKKIIFFSYKRNQQIVMLWHV